MASPLEHCPVLPSPPCLLYIQGFFDCPQIPVGFCAEHCSTEQSLFFADVGAIVAVPCSPEWHFCAAGPANLAWDPVAVPTAISFKPTTDPQTKLDRYGFLSCASLINMLDFAVKIVCDREYSQQLWLLIHA
jgi:hypothetical protein